MMRPLCAILGHGDLVDVREVAAYAEDLIAATGSVVYAGYCPRCDKRVEWRESLT